MKVSKFLKLTNKKSIYKTLGTSDWIRILPKYQKYYKLLLVSVCLSVCYYSFICFATQRSCHPCLSYDDCLLSFIVFYLRLVHYQKVQHLVLFLKQKLFACYVFLSNKISSTVIILNNFYHVSMDLWVLVNLWYNLQIFMFFLFSFFVNFNLLFLKTRTFKFTKEYKF